MIEVEGVRLTSPDRILYREQAVTKRALAEYYAAVGERVLAYAGGRPLTLVRCPKGQNEKCFYQKHVGNSIPDAVRTVEIRESGGRTALYMYVDSLAGLVALVQVGTLEIHLWGSRVDRLDRPDHLVFDLDPGPDALWEDVVAAAREVRDRLEGLGLRSFAMITGGKGMHVVVPLIRRNDWDQAKRFARALSGRMAREAPDRYVDRAAKVEREGKIYVDYLRNARGATAIAPFSTRARSGAPVAVPLRWDELSAALRPDEYDLEGVRRRLSSLRDDPWREYFTIRQSLTKQVLGSVDQGSSG